MASLLNMCGAALMNKIQRQKQVYDFEYTGAVQSQVLAAGTYKLEVWGAQGGSYSTTAGGKGGYSAGIINIPSQTTVYVYVGGQGAGGNTAALRVGGFNGGGDCYGGAGYYFGSGGGASDIRIGQDSLYARVIVAGGGGGCGSRGTRNNRFAGGYGGGTSGGAGGQSSFSYRSGTGGSATAAGTSYNGSTADPTNYNASLAGFGVGGGRTSGTNMTAGGGGGWYGGGFSASGGGGGGSGYVYTSSTKNDYPSEKLITDDSLLTETTITAGNDSIPKTDGSGNETGHTGNGYVRITEQ